MSAMSLPDQNAAVENPTVSLRVAGTEEGLRIDAYLASQIDGWSRARLQRLIDDQDVLVNGKTVKSSYKLREGDEIEVELSPPPSSTFQPENIPIDVIYEDDEVVVVNKPAGLVVHPAAGVNSGTLANALAYRFQDLSGSGGVIRPGIVHRLDKDTSGVMVVAKTELAHEKLSDQFRAREVFKRYVALVYGVVKQPEGRVEQPIARDPRNRTRMAVVPGGREALSLFSVRRQYGALALVDVELKTGRTHQIRVHLSWLKHPVVGDELYGGGRENSLQNPQLRAQVRKLSRQFLHAEELGFTHPVTGQPLRFFAPLPVELSEFLERLEVAAQAGKKAN